MERRGANPWLRLDAEEMVLKILGWLDPIKKPLIIMGTESELRALRSR